MQSGSVDNSSPGWSSRFAFLMASIGFAVGLGNIWRFPYITGENGGGAFVIIYLICAVTIAVPILMSEVMIGRRGKMSPPGAMAKVAIEQGKSPRWSLVGMMGLLTAFLIMVTYCVVTGWVLNYLFVAISTGFSGVDAASSSQAFGAVQADVVGSLFWTFLGLSITGSIIYAGVQNGIERSVTILMPCLFAMMVALVIYNMVVGGFDEALAYMFSADFSKITPSVILIALGQAFFSIGVAMGGMMTFGAYLPDSVSIPRSVVLIVLADTTVALMAGLVIFPAVFLYGLDPGGGPGLIFQTLPVAFAQMPGGHLVSVVFFTLLSVAAVTSMVGLIEPQAHWLEEHRGFSRHSSTLVIMGSIATLGVFSVLGYNVLIDSGFNATLDYISNQILLPVGGLLIAIFAAWFMNREDSRSELAMHDGLMFRLWYFLIRFAVPPAVFVVFVLGVM